MKTIASCIDIVQEYASVKSVLRFNKRQHLLFDVESPLPVVYDEERGHGSLADVRTMELPVIMVEVVETILENGPSSRIFVTAEMADDPSVAVDIIQEDHPDFGDDEQAQLEMARLSIMNAMPVSEYLLLYYERHDSQLKRRQNDVAQNLDKVIDHFYNAFVMTIQVFTDPNLFAEFFQKANNYFRSATQDPQQFRMTLMAQMMRDETFRYNTIFLIGDVYGLLGEDKEAMESSNPAVMFKSSARRYEEEKKVEELMQSFRTHGLQPVDVMFLIEMAYGSRGEKERKELFEAIVEELGLEMDAG